MIESVDEFLTETVTIQRAPQPTSSDSGSAQRVYATHLSNVPASIQARTGTYRQQEFGLARDAMFVGYFKVIDLKVGDRVVHGSETYEAMFVANRHGNHLEVDLQKVIF